MAQRIGLKTMNQGATMAMGTLALPPLVIEGSTRSKAADGCSHGVSHSFTVPSMPAVATVFPSCENVTK
jgi:hypothetical protein